jgi:SAM-dependent methyltransferase
MSLRVLWKKIVNKMRYLLYPLYDLFHVESAIPKPSMRIYIGGGSYVAIGLEFMNYFINLGGLKPYHKVLDMGCGIGRMALPLTGYLSKEGEYFGFDIVPKGIEWCKKNIRSKFSNFHFELLDIFNKFYNPKGKLPGASFAFPYPDNYFDFAYATSLFTHLMPEDAANYLREAHRVLKPGGVLFSTWLLFEDKNKVPSKFKMTTEVECFGYKCLIKDFRKPEALIAYEHRFISDYSDKLNFKISNVYPGSWDGKQEYLSCQDVVVFSKK